MTKIKTMEELICATERSTFFIVGAIAFFILGYMIWFVVINDQQLSIDSGDWGAFGDFVGGILNPLIAYLALFWLTKSIVIQRTELEATRNLLSDQVNMAKKESARIQLQEYMQIENDRLASIFNSHKIEPFNFESELGVVGISSFEQLKSLFSSELQKRTAFLESINRQIFTFYGADDDHNRRKNEFNDVLRQISASIEHLSEYVFLFIDVSEIHQVSAQKLDELSGFVRSAYLVGAISIDRHDELIDEINRMLILSEQKYQSFKTFLRKIS